VVVAHRAEIENPENAIFKLKYKIPRLFAKRMGFAGIGD
jgi:hypothetical protein